jgi:hypothetical protein
MPLDSLITTFDSLKTEVQHYESKEEIHGR